MGIENYHIYALKPEGGGLLELIPAGETEKGLLCAFNRGWGTIILCHK